MNIQNKTELRYAYDRLLMLQEMKREGGSERLAAKILIVKKEIRSYLNRPEKKETLVKDYGIDGFILKIDLPDWIKSEDDAVEYFKENEEIRISPSPFDCTGRLFTSWYKVFNTNGTWKAYHSIGADV